jgi:hypothetical protein
MPDHPLVGESENGVAVSAHSKNNHSVFSVSDTGNGVVGQSKGKPAGGNAGVFGEHLNNGTGVTGKSGGGFGVAGISQSNHAVFGHSETGTGVFSESAGGIAVQAFSVNNHALYSKSETGNGVIGHSSGNPAGGNAGVFGEHLNNGTGVTGKSGGGFGVAGISQSNHAIYAESETGIGIYGKGGRLAGRFEGDVEITGHLHCADVHCPNEDCAEDFNVADPKQAEPGTVMVVGPDGALHQSQLAYDKRVAGVVSGAGLFKPGIVLGKQSGTDLSRKAIALLGKTFCKVDASHAPIEVGDLLTTSEIPGHAMKAADPLRAFGAVIGKALLPLAAGQGLIPILIALQ